MTLSRIEKAKVNAALLELRAGGHDISEVTELARTLIGMGTPEKKAYGRAFDGLVAKNPSLHAPLQRIGQLIDASDNQTVARYNVAMEAYIRTGDAAHIDAITPLVQHQLREMATKTGDAGFANGLPESTGEADGRGRGPTGFSAKVANSPPPAPLPPAAPSSRPGVGPTGYNAARAREEAATNPIVAQPPARPGWPAGGAMGFQPGATKAAEAAQAQQSE